MGRALYRKYRSKTLDEVVGQKHITDTLKNALKKGAVSHAYLFTGPKGVGKTSVARILAHEINNLPYEDEASHLDIIEIDAASNRRIDEIRDLRDKVHIVPTSARYKVYIIDEVHMLTREAFNALLKTLEEPPEHAVFILATTESHKVPETIISRTQRYTFKPIDEDMTVEHLNMIARKEKLQIDEPALRLIARHGKGSFRDSISMLDQIAGLDGKIDSETVSLMLGLPDDALLNDLLVSIKNNDSTLMFDTSETFRSRGSAPSVIAQALIESLRSQLANKNCLLDSRQAITIMKDLLAVTGAQGSFEQLEIALLDSFTFAENTQEKESPAEAQPKVQDINEVPVQETVISKTAVEKLIPPISAAKPTSSSSSNDQDKWLKVLDALKGKHNTLYGILRMATADIDEDQITLTFSFEFHRKQLQQNKYLDTLHTTITDQLGKKIRLDIVVQKDNKKKTAEITTTDKNALSNVSNIFGGAELLES